MSRDTIYLDHAASVPLHPVMREAMLPWLDCANPSSAHAPGRAAAAAVERARDQVARLLGAAPDEIVFTSGATESNNLAIFGATDGRAPGHVVTSRLEHKAVIDPIRQLESRGWRVTWLEPDAEGAITPDAVKAAMQDDTALVSLMWVNNEIGTVTDIPAIGALCRARGVLLHVDAAQAAAWIGMDVHGAQVDLLSLTAQKMAGPKGVGALFVRGRPPLRLRPRAWGGGQERGLRPGTLAVHQIVALGTACERVGATRETETPRVEALRERAWAQLAGALDGLHRNASQGAPHILNISLDHVNGESLVAALSDIALSTGSACSSASASPSYVLRALGRSDALAEASLRLSFGWPTTEAMVDAAVARIVAVVQRLRSLRPDHAGALSGDAGTFVVSGEDPVSRGFARLAHAACTWTPGAPAGRATTPASDAVVAIRLRRGDGRDQAHCRAHGCPATLAAADWLCAQVDAHGLDAAARITAAQLADALALPRTRMPAALLAVDALKAAAALARHPGPLRQSA